MPTATEMRTESARPDPEARVSLADRAILRVPGGRVTESTGPAPPFEVGVAAGVADAFGSGWPTLREEVLRWS
jgi:hypothetical protein